MGKGSQRRNEDIKKIWDNWDAIFGKKDKPEEKPTDGTKPAEHDKKDAK